jgi:type I restriction enzyme S subunit
LQKSDFRDQGEPCIHYGQIHTKFGSVVQKNLTFIDKALFSKLRKATYGNLVIADTAEDFLGVARGVAWMGAHEVAVGGHALIYDHGFDPIYIAYFLRSHSFQAQKNQLAKGVKIKDISGKALGKIAVPVPNMEVQRSIGRQLANLDNLAKDASIGLPAEISARRRQYEYYRKKLLTFKELEAA